MEAQGDRDKSSMRGSKLTISTMHSSDATLVSKSTSEQSAGSYDSSESRKSIATSLDRQLYLQIAESPKKSANNGG